MVARRIDARADWVRVPGPPAIFKVLGILNLVTEACPIGNVITCGKAQQVNGS